MPAVEFDDVVKVYGKGDAIDWPCYISPATYIISAVFVMTVSVLVSFLFSRRIKKIDMVEVLKGME